MKLLKQLQLGLGVRWREHGSTLIIALITLAILSFAVAAVSVSVSSTANVSLQAASWQEALMAAEAGADTAMASLRVALDEPQFWTVSSNALTDTLTGATAWPSASPAPGISTSDGKGWTTITASQKLSLSPVFRVASGPNTGMQAAVTIEAPSTWVDSNGQWYRVRSTGVAGIAGLRRSGLDKRDNDLRKISLMNMRSTRSGYLAPQSLGTAQVTRSIELIIKPLASGAWDRAITAMAAVNLGAAPFVVDSYNSTDPAKSTNGMYDPAKRGSDANIASNANGQFVNVNGADVYGSVATDGGTAKATQNVTGTVTNNFYEQYSDISAPTWTIYNATPSSINQVNATLTGGPSTSPQRYVLSAVNLKGNTLTFAPHAAGAQSYVEIWAQKDFLMSNAAQIIIEPGVHVSIYIAGLFSATGSSITNQTNNVANLSLYGIAPTPGTNPQWAWNSISDFSGTIYGPEVKFKVTGGANFYGAIIANTVTTGSTAGTGFHFDEALLKSGGSTPRYEVASWIEDVR